MKMVKTLIVAMSAMIVAGFILLAYGVYSKVGKKGAANSAPAGTPSELTVIGDLVVPGDTIIGMRAAGSRLYVLVRDGKTIRIHILNVLTGAALGTVSTGRP